ncbi:MAG: NAD-dependent epimerase/dehydratase family protein [Bdellovibrionales bacterium]
MKIIVSGASGYIGRHLVQALAKAGHEVVALTRRPSDDALFADPRIHSFVMDSEGRWSASCLGASMFIHAAGRAHRKNPEGLALQTLFRRDNVELSLKAARVAIDLEIPSFALISSIGAALLEKEIAEGRTDLASAWQKEPYRASKLEVETSLQTLFQNEPSKTTLQIIRLPMVYGLKAPGNFTLLSKLIRTKLPLPFASVSNRRAFLSTANLDSFFVHLAERGHWPSGRWAIRDADELSTPDFIRAIAEESFGQKACLFPFPPALIEAAGKVFGLGGSMESLLGSLSIDLAPVKRDLDWAPLYTVRESLALGSDLSEFKES